MNIQQPKWWVQWNADLVKRQRCASTFYRDWSDFKVSDISGSGIQQVIRTQKEGSADETKPYSCNCAINHHYLEKYLDILWRLHIFLSR